MKPPKPDNKTLDLIGERLMAERAKAAEVIDNVVSNPDLFARVQANISSEQKALPSRLSPVMRYATALMSVAIVTIAAIGAVRLLRSSSNEVAIRVQDPALQPVKARPEPPPPIGGPEDYKPSSGRALDRPLRAERPTVQNASYSTSNRVRPQRDPQSDGEFYPISYGGDQTETTGGHIVRVDVPRSSLFALGVNVPLENDSETVKADLLVGPDGVTRAIRVVK